MPLFPILLAVLNPMSPLPITQLRPAVLVPNLCEVRYTTSSPSPQCQAFCDQGLGYYYSYVYMEAARSFETALRHDPDCVFAWLGLARSLDKWGKTNPPKSDPYLALAGGAMQGKLPERLSLAPRDYALEQAKARLNQANHREKLLVTAKLHERGLLPGTTADTRKKKATETLDELLSLYEDDEEGWYARAQIAEGTHGPAPFYKALLQRNPIHPGANHEFVHYYESVRRPALGWPYAEGYMKSSPGIPHAFHMQAHLGMRIGKWETTTNDSVRAIELERAYHRAQGVRPDDDHQFSHHLETLTRSLIHDGRFADAKTLKAEVEGYRYYYRPEWFRMALLEQDYTAATEQLTSIRKSNKLDGAYYGGLLALEQGDTEAAEAHRATLEQAASNKRDDKKLQLRLNELRGRLACRTGDGTSGLKLIARTIEKTKDDFAHHSWAGGAYYMEVWGYAALEVGDAEEAEEAFQEALAHDSG
ncbi:MAG: tetratricopeptide repeat protein, partial [Gemmataceae bacterium]